MRQNKTSTLKRKSEKPNRKSRDARTGHPVPRSFYWWPVTDEKIQRAAQKIVDGVNPEKIILFGSFAYGKPTPDSDVDLLVVMESKERIHKRMMELSEILDPRSFPVEIITRTPLELRHRLEIGDCFFKEIISRGKVLYERESS